MRYRVELGELLAFVDRLESFERRAEDIAARVDGQIAALHDSWSGDAAEAHRAVHDEWMRDAAQMREAAAHLRTAARDAHRNYTGAAQLNVQMLT